MRPLQSAPVPQVNQNVNGVDTLVNKTVSDYKDWRRDLADAYGNACCYCGEKLPFELQVEHCTPQSSGVVDPLAWDNLLLACGPCNNHKNATVFSPSTHVMPLAHNPLLAFALQSEAHPRYRAKVGCKLIPHPSLSAGTPEHTIALQTIQDLGLGTMTQTAQQDRRMTDIRWQNMQASKSAAEHQLRLWNTLSDENQRMAFVTGIVDQEIASGHWGIWHITFAAVPQVLQSLRNALPGTAQNCFDPSTGAPTARVAGLF